MAQLIGDGLYGYSSESYWMDIGTPERYLKGTFDIIEGNVHTAVRERLGEDWMAGGGRCRGARQGDPAGCPRARRAGSQRARRSAAWSSWPRTSRSVPVARVERAVILAGSVIGEDCELRDCIIGPRCRIGRRTRITGGAVLGEGVGVGADNVITRGARIFPGVQLPDGAIEF